MKRNMAWITLLIALAGLPCYSAATNGGLPSDGMLYARSCESFTLTDTQGMQAKAAESSSVRGKVLLDRLRSELEPLMKRIVTHRYLDALEQRKVRSEALKQLALQQYFIVTNGIRNIALLVSRFGDQPSRTALNGFLQAEYSVHDALMKFVRAVGLDEQALAQGNVLPKALMFSYFETFVCLYGSDADLITAFYFDAQVWIKNAARVAKALKTMYGFSPEDVAFFELYANYQPAETDVLPWIEKALERGVTEHQIAEATRLLLEYELAFWDAMAETAGVASK